MRTNGGNVGDLFSRPEIPSPRGRVAFAEQKPGEERRAVKVCSGLKAVLDLGFLPAFLIRRGVRRATFPPGKAWGIPLFGGLPRQCEHWLAMTRFLVLTVLMAGM